VLKLKSSNLPTGRLTGLAEESASLIALVVGKCLVTKSQHPERGC
jgi:hypothetical protein